MIPSGCCVKSALLFLVAFAGFVRAQNDFGSRPPVSLIPPHEVLERQVGGAMIITCLTNQGHETIWMNQHKQQIRNRGRIHVELTKTNGYSLVFESIEKDDEGNYTCKTVVDGREHKKHFRLTVIVPTSFNGTSEIQETELGQDMTLRCYAKGIPTPTVIWHFNGKALEDNDKHKVLQNGLLIRNVSLADRGVYECRAYQIASFTSTIKEFKITARIQHKPTFPSKEDSSGLVHGYLTGKVNLTCQATAEPKPKFEWIKDDKPIVENENVFIYNEDHSSTLELELANSSMFGDYVCKAINKLGTTEKVLVLKEGDRPGPPHMVSDLHATSDSVQMKIVPPEGGMLPISGFRVEYVPKHSDHIRWDEAKFSDFDKEEDGVYFVRGLSHDTTYVLRVQSRNVAGHSIASEEKTIRTQKLQADSVTKSLSVLVNLPISIVGLLLNSVSVRHVL